MTAGSSTHYQSELALALELADIADHITLPLFRSTGLRVERKPDATPVTEADRGAEDALRRHLASARPQHAVVGEEYGSTGTAPWRWIIDPVDGTKNFVRGIPVWATLIALQHEDHGVVGVASAPALGRRWWAVSGGGAFADGRPIHVSPITRLEDAMLSYDTVPGFAARGLEERFLALLHRCARSRGFGDFWSHALVAEGAVDITVEPEVNLWDLAALQVIVEEAGGQLTDLSGQARADGGSVVTSNGLLHDAVLQALNG
jgi:histidinol-phosphatase